MIVHDTIERMQTGKGKFTFQKGEGNSMRRKVIAVLGAFALVLLCTTSALADAEWMETMTANRVKYVGFVENGSQEGFGISTYTEGGYYYGIHANGLRHGFGIYLFPDTDSAYLYSGTYLEGKRNGRGIFQYRDGRRYDGPFEDGKRSAQVGFSQDEYGFVSDVLLSDGNTFSGEVLPGTTTPNGFGVLIMQDGAIYVGEFASGVCEGYGLFLSPEKQVYSGMWENNELVDPGAEWK